jgi:hypothetical protein
LRKPAADLHQPNTSSLRLRTHPLSELGVGVPRYCVFHDSSARRNSGPVVSSGARESSVEEFFF